jgi:uncharacterized lipoprotein YajG
MSGRRVRRGLAIVAALVGVGGCGAALEVRYPERGVTPALLSSVEPRRVIVGPVSDRRADRTRIGVKPKSRDAIVARRPVEEIVREALTVELAGNGHAVVDASGDVRLAAEVEEFWLDAAKRRGATQYVGRVAIALVVVDAHSGDRLLTRRYVGIKRREGPPDAATAWREVLEAALARTIHDLATDPEVVAALAPR